MGRPAKRRAASSAESSLGLSVSPSEKSHPSSRRSRLRDLSSKKPNSSKGQTFSSKCPLLKLSSELRIMIFSQVMPTSGIVWKSEDCRWVPVYVAHAGSPLLTALRPEPVLYQDALQIFRNQNAYSILQCTPKTVLSASAAQSIRKMYLNREYGRCNVRRLLERKWPSLVGCRPQLKWTENLEELYISGPLSHSITRAWTEKNSAANSQAFPKLRKLTVGPLYPSRASDISKIEDFIAKMNRYLGVCAKLDYVLQKRGINPYFSAFDLYLERVDVAITQYDIWFWEVPAGMAFWNIKRK